jgi:nitroreductase
MDWVGGKAAVTRADWCIGCGHCVAVCPTEALAQELPPSERQPIPGPGSVPSPETLELLLRERRSVRRYREDPVPPAVLQRVLEAGRYAPTGSNSQNVHYLVLTSPEEISRLWDLTIAFYEKIFSWARGRLTGLFFSLFAGRKTVEYLRSTLAKVEYAGEQREKGKDILFYHAPVIILTHAESWDSSSSFNCSVALYHSSLLAHTLGLGCCFNGFLVNAANHDKGIKEWLGIPQDHKCFSAMTLGYPKVKYRRLVHRNPLRVKWR